MPVTRINNNQITDASAGNLYLGINAAAKLQDYSITSTKIANSLTYGSDLTIAGNLTVQGNTTTIDTVNVVVEDPLILLAAAQTGSPTLDIGFIGKRGTEDNIAFVWDEANNVFVTAFTTSEVTNTVITINSYASFKTFDAEVAGNLSVTGTTGLTGNVTIGNLFVNGQKTLDMGNSIIGNVQDPVANSDVATKAYVDSQSASGFTIEDDTANTTTVSGGDTLQLLGTTNEVEVLITADDQITFGLPTDVTVAGNLSAGNLAATNAVTGASGSFTGNVSGGNLDATNGITAGTTIVATGNVSGGNLTTAGDVTTATVTASSTVTATGNVSGGNLTTAGDVTTATVTASGNVAGGNLTTGGQVAAVGNVSGGNLVTSGATVSNSVTATGNVTGGNLVSQADVTTVTVTASSTVTATGNVSGGNITTAGDVTTATVTASGNIGGGNLNTGGQVAATGNITGGNLNTAGTVAGAIGTFTGNITGANLDVTGGMTAGTTIVATGNITGANLNTAGAVVATGNVTGGNVNTAGQVIATGNVTGGNLTTAGNIDGGNLNVTGGTYAATGSFVGNVTAGNVTVAAGTVEALTVTATGNVNGANVNTNNLVGTALEITSTGTLTLTSTTDVIDVNGARIAELGTPTQSTDAATKQYVDDAVSTGITIHPPVYVETPVALPAATYAQGGTTATVTDTIAGNTVVFSSAINPQVNDQLWFTNSFQGIVANTPYFVVSAPNTSAAVLSSTYNGVPVTTITSASGLTQGVRINSGQGATLTATSNGQLTVDGVALTGGERVLVYQQATAYENGVYDVTVAGDAGNAWVLTRSSDMDTYIPEDINGLDAGDYFFVQAGLTGAGESYVLTAPIGPTIIGYNSITFTQFSASSTYSANTQAGLSLNGTIFSAKVDNNTTAFDGSGNIIVKTGANLVTPNIGDAVGNSLTLTGNGLLAATTVSATGNVSGGNLVTVGAVEGGTATITGNVSGGNFNTAGNVTAAYFIGNGSQLTGVAASSVNAADLTGNTLSGNVLFSSLTTVGNLVSLTVDGTATVGNLSTGGTVTATGNVSGGNLTTAGAVDAATVTATGNVAGGNLTTAGQVAATGNITGGNINTGGAVIATGNIDGGNLNTSGTINGAAGEFTGNVTGGNINTGGIVIATGNVTGGNVIAIGGVVSTTVVASGNVTGANLDTAGEVVATGNVTGGNLVTAAGVYGATGTFTGNITGGNLDVTGGITAGTTIIATGNVTGGNITTAGAVDSATVTATGNITGGNLNTAGAVIATGNVDGGNINTGGAVTATGNVTGGNIVTTGDVGAATVTATGNISGGNINVTGEGRFGNIVISGDNITDVGGNIVTINGAAENIDFSVGTNGEANSFFISGSLGTASFGSETQTTGALVSFNSTDSILVPVGNTAQRPATGVTGMLRFNTQLDALEYYDNNSWQTADTDFTVITADTFNGDGSTTQFTLSTASTTAGTIVAINGVVQIPTTAYSVSGTTLTFTEAPEVSDVIDARVLTTTATVTVSGITGNAGASFQGSNSTIDFDVLGNLVPTANVTYDLGSATNYWRDLYLSGSSIRLGNIVLKNVNGAFQVFQSDGSTPAPSGTTSLVNGTSNVVVASSGNVSFGIAGTSDKLLVSGSGIAVSGNVVATNLTGTLTTAAQPNITSVGQLTSLGVTGNITSGNVSGTNLTGTIATAAQPNITSVGTLTSLAVSGNLSLGANILNTGANGTGNIGSSTTYFNTVFAKATSAQYADLAEMYEADGHYEPGTVVVFGGAKEVTVCAEDSSKRIAGVVSTNPSYIMNSGLQGDHVVAVALQGRVPVKVTGTIRKGDMIVATGDGRGRAEADPKLGSVIGKALADFDGTDGVIEVVVGRV